MGRYFRPVIRIIWVGYFLWCGCNIGLVLTGLNQWQLVMATPKNISGYYNNTATESFPTDKFTLAESWSDPAPGIDQPEIRGIYVTSWMAGNSKFIGEMLDFTSKTAVNAMVIDVKADDGTISYPSTVPLAVEINSFLAKYDPRQVLERLKGNGIYPIARIVVFKDPFLAKKRPDLAVKRYTGGLWQDYKGLNWMDPYNELVWDYNIAIAKEAVQLGFQEIQFDYIRFTSDGPVKECYYPGFNGKSRVEIISGFLQKACRELKPMGAKVSVDIFGLACSAQNDLGIGQVLENVAVTVDIVCPMVYPSHFYYDRKKSADPDKNPYKTVYNSLVAARERLAKLERRVVLRPWLQDFSLRSHYGKAELLAQVKAVQEAGLTQWIFWNPSNRYNLQKYQFPETIYK